MKKVWVYACLILMFATLGCGSPRRENDLKRQERKGLVYILKETKPYTGIIYKKWPSGKLKLELTYKDGKEHGSKKTWYENGQLMSNSIYKDGKLNGLYKLWYKNGKLWFEKNIKMGNWLIICKFLLIAPLDL